jgi:flagellar hook-length control protein FliK
MYDPAVAQPETGSGPGQAAPEPTSAAPAPAPLAPPVASGLSAPTAAPSAAPAQQAATAAGPIAAASPAAPRLEAPGLSAATPAGSDGAPVPSPAEAIEATIRLGARHGFSRARLTLRPAELGTVEVTLKTSQYGVSASVFADTPEAAHLLEGSSADLRRQLERQGVQLLDLAVSVSFSTAHDPRAGSGSGGAGQSPEGATGAAGELRDEPTEPTRTIELGGGVLIDVLA